MAEKRGLRRELTRESAPSSRAKRALDAILGEDSESRNLAGELARNRNAPRAGRAYARDDMIDISHPIVKQLVAEGYRLAVHAYLRDGKVKTTVVGKHPETGKILQGWSRDGCLDRALVDLAGRSGLTSSHTA